MSNVVITWPKKRSLESYLKEVERAEKEGLFINFRIPSKPKAGTIFRCYIVHDGMVRGYNLVKCVATKAESEVTDPVTGEYMKAGWYIVRYPIWFPIDPIPMKGFQGYRYFS